MLNLVHTAEQYLHGVFEEKKEMFILIFRLASYFCFGLKLNKFSDNSSNIVGEILFLVKQ